MTYSVEKWQDQEEGESSIFVDILKGLFAIVLLIGICAVIAAPLSLAIALLIFKINL